MTALSCTVGADTFRCPTKWELWQQTMASLPRGRAWQSHEDSVERTVTGYSSEVDVFETGQTGVGAEPIIENLTTLEQYWASHAEVLEYLHQRACALTEEFYCDTTAEQRQEWGVDYGFPDPCEPWDQLCAKVAAIGGATCAYLSEVAAARGWHVECVECNGPEAECLMADCDPLCECKNAIIEVLVDTALSPASDADWLPMQADAMQADCHDECPPIPEEMLCLIERIKPAHVLAIYTVI